MRTCGNEVWMSQKEFDNLLEYSTTIPTGVTIGKVWKRRGLGNSWFMGEYVDVGAEMINIKWRTIVIKG